METLATNTSVFENTIFEPVKVASSAALFVDEYNRPNLRQLHAKNSVVAQAKWQPPPHDEASVMARYDVIKSRADQPCINTDDLETPSNIADKLASREIYNKNRVNFCQDFTIPGKNKADYETFVLARFHILKSQATGLQWLSLTR